MNEFTLSTVLNSIKRHLLVTFAVFVVTFWSLSSSNIIDNKYTLQKTINIGTAQPSYPVDFLNFEEMHAILNSPITAQSLRSTLGNDGVAEYVIGYNKVENLILTLKSHNIDNLVNTANLIVKKLSELDELSIQKKIRSTIDISLSRKKEYLQRLISRLSSDYYTLSSVDIEQYASLKKTYDFIFENEDGAVVKEYRRDLDKILALKKKEVDRKYNIETEIVKTNNEIEELEYIKKNGFETVSYLMPVSRTEASKYYPNDMIFVSISLLVASFYNLIMLTFKYNKTTKQT